MANPSLRIEQRGTLPDDAKTDAQALHRTLTVQLARLRLPQPRSIGILLDTSKGAPDGAECQSPADGRMQIMIRIGARTDRLKLRHMLAHELGHVAAGSFNSTRSHGAGLAAEYIAERHAWWLLAATFTLEPAEVAGWEATEAPSPLHWLARARADLAVGRHEYVISAYRLVRSALQRTAFIHARGRSDPLPDLPPVLIAALVPLLHDTLNHGQPLPLEALPGLLATPSVTARDEAFRHFVRSSLPDAIGVPT